MAWTGALIVGFGLAFACGSSAPLVAQDAGSDGATLGAEADVADAAFQPTAYWPSIVLVDGLVNGNAISTAKTSLTLDDVRVCLFDAGGNALTPYALPDAKPMPLANYPGVRRGRGIDLGEVSYNGPATIAVFRADDLSADAAWATNRAAYTCSTMTCDTGQVPCRDHALLQTTITDDVDVMGLVDGAGGNINVVSTAFEETPYAGTQGALYAGVVDFSGWHAGESVSAYFGNFVDGSGTPDTLLADPLAPNTASAPVLATSKIAGYEALGIRFDQHTGQQVADRFGESLDTISFVSDATSTPPTFYGVRQNFVVALVGDPNDLSFGADAGRDPTFDGRALHLIAVPYATPRPKP